MVEPEGFGEDKLIYAILFMCVVVYNFSLLLYAVSWECVTCTYIKCQSFLLYAVCYGGLNLKGVT